MFTGFLLDAFVRLQLRLDRARLLSFNTGRRADLDVAVAEVVVSDTALVFCCGTQLLHLLLVVRMRVIEQKLMHSARLSSY